MEYMSLLHKDLSKIKFRENMVNLKLESLQCGKITHGSFAVLVEGIGHGISRTEHHRRVIAIVLAVGVHAIAGGGLVEKTLRAQREGGCFRKQEGFSTSRSR